MAHLIDKDALVAKIEKLTYAANLELDIASTGDCFDENIAAAKYQLCNYILGVINTLEVKEVDLEKEIRDFMQLYHLHIKDGGRIVFENNDSPNLMCDMRSIAKHFFELGLKAQHDNWKVVDNTNLPQVDRNTVYCVFTKQKYILATVINHPQDEDLLQWKCTEFPFHRYYMCEGDKYMQIV